eukprot:g13730.t1
MQAGRPTEDPKSLALRTSSQSRLSQTGSQSRHQPPLSLVGPPTDRSRFLCLRWILQSVFFAGMVEITHHPFKMGVPGWGKGGYLLPRPVICCETGEVFPSVGAAAKRYGNVKDALRRGAKAGGYHWCYRDDDQ